MDCCPSWQLNNRRQIADNQNEMYGRCCRSGRPPLALPRGTQVPENESSNWLPIHENHAIDVMAVKVDFAQLIPVLLLRKILRVAEEGAFGAGLRSRHSLAGQVATGSAGGMILGAIQGQFFNALAETAEGEPVSQKVGEQLQVDQTAVTYRTWRYVSWSWQVERLKTLMLPVLAAVGGNVAILRLQLEYLDRFRFDGDAKAAQVNRLIREGSPLVAPHIFSISNLWHSHTGSFLPSEDQTLRLQTVNIDAVNDPPAGEAMKRWVNIATIRQDTFSPEIVEAGGPSGDEIVSRLDAMHSELKEMLNSIITDALSARIYLKDGP